MTEHANPGTTLRYEEHLGRFGANFRIDFGDQINIVVGPLLAGSPHVVYTNVIEALLRFVMVSRGSMLLHSACISLDGVGVMLSALTDTGKTATVLRLLRDHGGHFLSDRNAAIHAPREAAWSPQPVSNQPGTPERPTGPPPAIPGGQTAGGALAVLSNGARGGGRATPTA